MTRVQEVDRGTTPHHYRVQDPWVGSRLDAFLSHHHPEWNPEVVYKLVRAGHIFRMKSHTGNTVRSSSVGDRLERNDVVVLPPHLPMGYERFLTPSIPEVTETAREKFSSRVRNLAQSWVLFKNAHVIVINKPPGVPVHQSPDSTAVNIQDMLPLWRYTNPHRPSLVHLLDKETSGCLILARTPSAHRMLHPMFVRRCVPTNVYWALLSSAPKARVGRIRMHMEFTRPLQHDDKGNPTSKTTRREGERIIVRPIPSEHSKAAIAEYTVNETLSQYGAWVSFYPLTNHRHQIRIMAAHALRSPILGDAKYGGNAAYPGALRTFWDPEDRGISLHLHHRRIQLPYKHKASGEWICVDAPLPPHMERTWDTLGWNKSAHDPFIQP